MSDDVTVEFDELKHETDEAYLVVIGDTEVWLPKSQVRIYNKAKKVFVPEWMAIKKGLI